MTASPQPGNQDEPVDLMARLRASLDDARAERPTAAAADQPGEEADEMDWPPPVEMANEVHALVDAIEPAPSAGQDTGP